MNNFVVITRVYDCLFFLLFYGSNLDFENDLVLEGINKLKDRIDLPDSTFNLNLKSKYTVTFATIAKGKNVKV